MFRLTALLAVLLSAGVAQGVAQGRNETAPKPSARDLLRSAKSWAYQLQAINARELAATHYEVLVVDTDVGRSDIQRLQRKPDGRRRIVLAYVNIGEAEEYRSYWNKSWSSQHGRPEWLGASNDRWKGDHRVRHWHPAWQAIVFGNPQSIFHRLVAAGFDGAYLDRVDIYQFWCGERPTSFADMVAFVQALSKWSKAQRPDFLVLPQNGEELLASDAYRAAIDAVGKEDYVFGDRGNEVQNYDTRIALETEMLAHATKAGIPIFAIEYARSPDNRRIASEHHAKLGSILYFGPRSLSYIGQLRPMIREDGDSEPYLALRGRRNCVE